MAFISGADRDRSSTRFRVPLGFTSRPVRITVAAFALAGLSCATAVKSLPDGYSGGAGSEAVVIGRVMTGLQKPVLEIFASAARLKVEHESGTDYEIVCDKTDPNSYFFVALPPGTYRLKGVTYGQNEGSLGGRFEVVADRVNYFGDLLFVPRTGVGGVLASVAVGGVVGDWNVMDQHEDAVLVIQRRYPQLRQEVVTSLVFLTGD